MRCLLLSLKNTTPPFAKLSPYSQPFNARNSSVIGRTRYAPPSARSKATRLAPCRRFKRDLGAFAARGTAVKGVSYGVQQATVFTSPSIFLRAIPRHYYTRNYSHPKTRAPRNNDTIPKTGNRHFAHKLTLPGTEKVAQKWLRQLFPDSPIRRKSLSGSGAAIRSRT